MVKNFLITGPPGCGKTTLIKEILKEIKIKAQGFFTEEIRKENSRVGFEIVSLEKKRKIFAHKDFKSPFQVSKYKVDLKAFEEIALEALKKGLEDPRTLIVIDEIGRMELFSKKFQKLVIKAFNAPNKVLATIMLKPHPFCDKLKKRKDTQIFHLIKESFFELKKEIINCLNTG